MKFKEFLKESDKPSKLKSKTTRQIKSWVEDPSSVPSVIKKYFTDPKKNNKGTWSDVEIFTKIPYDIAKKVWKNIEDIRNDSSGGYEYGGYVFGKDPETNEIEISDPGMAL